MIQKILELAKSQIGTKENPPGSNKTKYGEAYGWNGVAWCVEFQWWLMHTLGWGKLFMDGNKTASCSALVDYYEKNHPEQVIPVSQASAGDWVIFQFSPSSRHIGICESRSAINISTIDGNTGPKSDQVMRRTRSTDCVWRVIRPAYTKKVHTTREITVWSAPAKIDANRERKIPEGYEVTVYETPFDANGESWYKTIKGKYVLAKYCV